jgi:F0F1-type ATP synthase assembly protein I
MSGPEEPRRPEEPLRGLAKRLRVPDPHAAKRGMASAYQGAIEAVAAMVLCALAGWWIDGRLGSEPIGLFAGMGIGFAAFLLRLLRIQAPTLGRAVRPGERNGEKSETRPHAPPAPSALPGPDDDEDEEPGPDWTRALTPNRDDDDEGSRPQ